MKTILLAAALVLAAAAPAAADITILDNQQKVTVNCAKDKGINILGNHAVVTLDGTCEKVTIAGNHASVTGSSAKVHIAGNHNTVSLDAVDELLVSGNRNTVSYKKGLKEKTSKVSISGKYNKVNPEK